MSPQTILYIVLIIITFDFVVDRILDYINLKASKSEIPDSVAEYYNKEKYHKSQEYHKTLTQFSFLTSSFSFILSFLVLSLGLFGVLDELLRAYFNNEIYLSLAYFGILFIVSDLINIPFQIYSTFVIEEKFGFNKTTPKTFILDKLKSYILTAIVGGIIIGILLFLILYFKEPFWLYFWIISAALILFVNMFYTSLILPLFNKLTVLEDGELKEAIQNYSQKIGFPLDNIFVIDGSKRSNKANAFFSGIGKKKKIVLYDTLINNHTAEELVAVLAHEVGHFKKKHVITSFFSSILQVGLMLFIMSRLIFSEEMSLALGADQLGIHLNMLAFGILYSPISKVLGILSNILSRKNEFEADEYAKTTYDGQALQKALKKLSVDNLSNLFHTLPMFS